MIGQSPGSEDTSARALWQGRHAPPGGLSGLSDHVLDGAFQTLERLIDVGVGDDQRGHKSQGVSAGGVDEQPLLAGGVDDLGSRIPLADRSDHQPDAAYLGDDIETFGKTPKTGLKALPAL